MRPCKIYIQIKPLLVGKNSPVNFNINLLLWQIGIKRKLVSIEGLVEISLSETLVRYWYGKRKILGFL